MGDRKEYVSEMRQFLNEHNMGIDTLAKLIGLGRSTVHSYEKHPDRCYKSTCIKIETALKMIRDEEWVRPYLDKRYVVDSHENFCLRDKHLRDVIKFEKAFKVRYRVLLERELAQNT